MTRLAIGRCELDHRDSAPQRRGESRDALSTAGLLQIDVQLQLTAKGKSTIVEVASLDLPQRLYDCFRDSSSGRLHGGV